VHQRGGLDRVPIGSRVTTIDGVDKLSITLYALHSKRLESSSISQFLLLDQLRSLLADLDARGSGHQGGAFLS
jgi:hypothetical protein